MKRMIAVVAVLLIVVFAASVHAKRGRTSSSIDSMKLGYVDLNRALNEVNAGKNAKAKLEADGKAKKQKLEILQNELKKMKGVIEKQRLILSAEALREKEMQFQQKFVELQKKTLEFEKDFVQKESNYIKPISEKMQKVIQQIGQQGGYTMIVPREMALYSLPGTDITSQVIAKFNKSK